MATAPGLTSPATRRRLARRAAIACASAVALSALAACGGSGAVRLPAPTPQGAVASDCAALIKALPRDLAPGQSPRAVTPTSPYTAAFGDPAVTVTCGGPVPKHAPTSFVEEVNGVDWLQLTAPGGAQRYVSYTSRLVVDIVIPHDYLPADVLLGIPQQRLGAPPARSND